MKNIVKYKIYFKLYGGLTIDAKNKKEAINKAHNIPIKKLIKNSDFLDKESKSNWEANRKE